jgi:hypothetical protein
MDKPLWVFLFFFFTRLPMYQINLMVSVELGFGHSLGGLLLPAQNVIERTQEWGR